jgi:DNA repair ATPase RecN
LNDKNTQNNLDSLYPKPENFAKIEQINRSLQAIGEQQSAMAEDLRTISETLSRLPDPELRATEFIRNYQAVESEITRQSGEIDDRLRQERADPSISIMETRLAEIERAIRERLANFSDLINEQTKKNLHNNSEAQANDKFKTISHDIFSISGSESDVHYPCPF